MKVLFDSDKNWDAVNFENEEAWCDDPEMVYNEWCETFLDDMRKIVIERMKVETTPESVEFPETRLYRWASIGDLLAKIDWGRLKVFVDDKNELRLEYAKDRVEYKARIYELCYIARRFVDAQVPLGAYIEKEYDEICAGRSVDLEAASKQALESLQQMHPGAVLMVNEISKRDFRDGKFDWDEAKPCDEYKYVAELLYAYRNSDSLGVVDDLQVVAVEQKGFSDAQEDYVCLHGIRVED